MGKGERSCTCKLAVYNPFDSTKNSWARQEESLVDGAGVHTIFFFKEVWGEM